MTITSDDLKLFRKKRVQSRATPKRTLRKQAENLPTCFLADDSQRKRVAVEARSDRKGVRAHHMLSTGSTREEIGDTAWLFILLIKNCYYCGRDCHKHGLPLESDHMYPVSESTVTGYYSTPIVTACKPCNMRKGPYPPRRGFVDVWVGRLLVGYVESKFAKHRNKPIPSPAERRIPCMRRPWRVL